MPRLIIKTLPNEVRQVAKLAKTSETRDFVTQLEARGWKRFNPSGGYSGTHYFTSPCDNFFLKQNYISSGSREKPPTRHIIPTVKLTKEGCYNWHLQAKADVSDTARAEAYEKLKKYDY